MSASLFLIAFAITQPQPEKAVTEAEKAKPGSTSLSAVPRSPLFVCLFGQSTILLRKMCLQFHRIMQNAPNLHDVRFGHAIKKEMAWTANPISRPASLFATQVEMIGSAMSGDFRPLNTAGKFWIGRDFLDRCRDQISVSPQGLWPEIFLRPGENARDVVARLRSDDDFHLLICRCSPFSSWPRFRFS